MFLPVATSRGSAEFLLPLGLPFRIDVTAVPALFEPWARGGVLADWGEVVATLTPKAGRISGRVVAAESRELLASVALSWAVSAEGHTHTGVARLEDGRLDFLAPAGVVRLETAATGRERARKEVPVSAGEWVQDVEFALPRLAQVSLSGRVLDDSGIPVPGARVSLRTLVIQDLVGAKTTILQDLGRIQSDVDGRFQYSTLTPGEHQLNVNADGFEPTGSISLEVAPDGAEVEIVLARAGALLVRAVDADGGLLEPTRIVLRQAGKVAIEAKRQSGRLSVYRERRNFRAHRIVAAKGEIAEYREGEMAGRYPDGGDVIFGIPPGEYEVIVEAPSLSGESKVFVGAEGTAVAEVRCR